MHENHVCDWSFLLKYYFNNNNNKIMLKSVSVFVIPWFLFLGNP